MKKILVFVVLIAIVILPLTSCSFVKSNNGSAPSANAPTESSTTASANAPADSSSETSANAAESSITAESTVPSVSSVQETTAATEQPVDESITLESVKKAAQDAGYSPEDMQELPPEIVPSPVRGIFINYKDETSESQSPVYEFKDSADALEFARQVNEQGYSLSIVNGKLVAMVYSKYGVVLSEKEKSVKEALMKSEVMAYEEPAPPQVSSSKDYAGACTRIDAICKALDKLVNKSVILYGKTLSAGDPNSIGTVSFSLVSSPDMSFTSILSEDQAKIDAVIKTWELYGCTNVKIKHDAPNDYIMTGKRAGLDTSFNIHCVYSPDKDSLRIIDKDGEIVEFFEFVPLGEDKYAFQTLYERAIVEYKDGNIISLTYSVNERTKEKAYNPDKVSIYPDGKGADTAWVSKSGEDTYEQFITFDGTKLQISAVDFTGAKLKAEINTK